MAQPNVAREPSMDEILASIRQIIESNEPGASKKIEPVVSTEVPPVAASEMEADLSLSSGDTSGDMPVLDDFDVRSDPRFVAANSAGMAREEPEASRPLSLADVAARVRAAANRHPEPVSQPAPAEHFVTETTIQPSMPAEAVSSYSVSYDSASSTVSMNDPIEDELIEPRETAAPEPDWIRASIESIAQAKEEPALNPTFTSDNSLMSFASIEPQALISQDSGQQVIRSFDELIAAVNTEQRSLQDIAEDMLRPMLREWLDDNLPTMVERLVREEIERIARGPRR